MPTRFWGDDAQRARYGRFPEAVARGETPASARPQFRIGLLPRLMSVDRSSRTHGPTIGLAIAAVRFRAKLSGAPSPAGPATERVLAGARRQGAVRSPGSLGAKRMQPPRSRPMVAGTSPAFAMRQSSPSRPMPCSASPKSPRSIAPMLNGMRPVPAGSPCAGRSPIRKARAPCTTSGRPPSRESRLGYRPRATGSAPCSEACAGGGHVTAERISARSVRTIIAKRAADAGIEGRVSGHSLRVGSAQSLAAAGASVVDMQTAGRWRDTAMPAHYARGALAGRGAVARLRYGA